MRKLIVFAFLLCGLGVCHAAAPLCLYQDVLSGPASGGEGGNGIYLSIFGHNFGATRGSSTVTVNGTPVAQYLVWGSSNDVTGEHDQISVQIASGTTGTGNIVVTTPGGSCSNLTFAVRSGHIWFIGSNVDNSAPTSCATMEAANSYSTPWGMTNIAQANGQSIYTPSTQRTPFTYYKCMAAGDTLVFLNGANFPYYDGGGLASSLGTDMAHGTAASPVTFMARPGAKAQLGGTGNITFGFRLYNEPYSVISGLSLTGSGSSGGGLNVSSQSEESNRVVGNYITCPDCYGAAAALDFGWNTVVYGNALTNISTTLGTPANKQYHAAYGGAGTGQNYGYDFEYNRIWNTEAYNGIQFNNGSINLYDITLANNDIADVYGACINMATVDPSEGYVNIYNNVLHHCGIGLSNDEGSGQGYHSCISFPENGAAVGGPGTANVYNNTMFDCSSYLNTYQYTTPTYSGAVTIATSLLNITVNLVNNAVYQPAYSQTGSQNVFMPNGGSTGSYTAPGTFTGSNNIWYSASTPGSTAYASTIGSVTANPLYVSATDGPWTNYKLQSTSPAIASGSASLYPVLDFAGNTRPSPPAIGALEFGSASSEVQVTVSATPTPATLEQPVTLTATVAQTRSSVPTGSINFQNGGVSLGQASLDSDGTATLVLSWLSVGSYKVIAAYSGDSNYPSSESGYAPLQVLSTTTASLTASPNPVSAGQTLTLAATLTGDGSVWPTGTVSFLNGTTLLGTATLNSSGVATLSTTSLAAGTYTLTAHYGGDTNFLSSNSAAVSVTVNTQATTTSLTATPNPVATGQTLTLTADVQGSGSSTPSGTVNFLSGSTLLGTATLNSSGVATLSTTSLAAGPYSLTAQYSGNANFLSSTSAAVSVTVSDQATTTSLAASPNPAATGQTLTLTADVQDSGSSAPAGTVSFLSGSTLLGTATLNSSGVATLSTTSLAAGTYSLTAQYSGTANFLSSTSAAVSVTVNSQTTTSLTASPNPAATGQTLTLTATVAGTGSDAPAGTVNFLSGSTLLGIATLNSSGVATISTTSLAAGAYSLTAQYSGTANSLSSTSAAVSVTVNAQATTTNQSYSLNTTGSTPSQTVQPGGAAVYTLSVSPAPGATLPAITFTASGLPQGYTATFSPQTIAAGSGATNVTLSIQVPAQSAMRGRDRKLNGGLSLVAFGILLLPFGGRIRRSGKRMLRPSCMVLLLVGATSFVGLAGCTASVSGAFSSSSPQTYTITVTTTSASVSQTTNVTLIVE